MILVPKQRFRFLEMDTSHFNGAFTTAVVMASNQARESNSNADHSSNADHAEPLSSLVGFFQCLMVMFLIAGLALWLSGMSAIGGQVCGVLFLICFALMLVEIVSRGCMSKYLERAVTNKPKAQTIAVDDVKNGTTAKGVAA